MMYKSDLFESEIEAIWEQTIKWRRHLHQYPEKAHEEFETANYIEHAIKQINERLFVERLLPTTVQTTLVGKYPGKRILLRADIDALAVLEATDLPFKSLKPGLMHACGHDGHTAILLSVLAILAPYQDRLSGDIVFVFQAAEEVAGARELIKTGFLETIDEAYALHLWPELEVGKYQLASGPIMAAGSWFDITIRGRGGHAGRPHETVDPINASLNLLSSIKTQLSRKINPLETHTFSVTYIHSGEATNVIPNNLNFGGTIRTLNQQLLLEIREIIIETLESYAKLYGFEFEATFEIDGLQAGDAPSAPLINDERLVKQLSENLSKHYGKVVEPFTPTLAGEDFSFYAQKVPVAFTMVGAAEPKESGEVKANFGLHHPQFTFDESALVWGIRLFLTITLTMIGEHN